MFEILECDGKVFVEAEAKWVSKGSSLNEAMRLISPLYKFYALESPVNGLSSMRVPLDKYGWSQPWKSPQYLNRRLKDCSSNPSLYWGAEKVADMELRLNASGLGCDSLRMSELKEVAVFFDCKHNQTLSLFYHLRNSFAHGRFAVITHKREKWFVFEDVQNSRKSQKENLVAVTARIVLKNSTLTKWIALIKEGPKNI